jgi:hypothetical protein
MTPDDNVEEWFIRLSLVSEDRPAASTSGYVSNLINGFQCNEKLVAQTYDGAEVTASGHNGLQKLIRDK